jgi:1,5-anhydro-D-fructose reductase (1,5-anhydro-D-mannitol-forming)
MVRVAVVGLGLIGRLRASALQRIEGAVLAAAVDPAADRSEAALGVPHHRTLDELPPDSYDAAVVAVPHDCAVAAASRVLEAGKPVLVEKPAGLRGADTHKLEALAAGVSIPSFVGYNYRYLPAIGELTRRAARGGLGELRNIDLLVGHGGNPRSAEGWKLDPARAGGGVLLDPGVHLLDLLLRIAPDVHCTAIEATRGFWPTGIEEDVVATFRDGPTIATVRVSHIRWVNTFRVEVFGEEGYGIAEGRGGNYGEMTLRVGRRWGWMAAGAAGQRDSEEVRRYGARDDSLHDELVDVVAIWSGGWTADGEERAAGEATAARGGSAAGEPRPATMSEARRVVELCDSLYPKIAAEATAAKAGATDAAKATEAAA